MTDRAAALAEHLVAAAGRFSTTELLADIRARWPGLTADETDRAFAVAVELARADEVEGRRSGVLAALEPVQARADGIPAREALLATGDALDGAAEALRDMIEAAAHQMSPDARIVLRPAQVAALRRLLTASALTARAAAEHLDPNDTARIGGARG